jgi:hypothetical protein
MTPCSAIPGDLEAALHDREGLEKAKNLILKAYQKG